jgi:hypothetical protein
MGRGSTRFGYASDATRHDAPALLQHHCTLNSDNLKESLLADFYIHHPESLETNKNPNGCVSNRPHESSLSTLNARNSQQITLIFFGYMCRVTLLLPLCKFSKKKGKNRTCRRGAIPHRRAYGFLHQQFGFVCSPLPPLQKYARCARNYNRSFSFFFDLVSTDATLYTGLCLS